MKKISNISRRFGRDPDLTSGQYLIFLIFFVLFFSNFLFGIESSKAATQETCASDLTICNKDNLQNGTTNLCLDLYNTCISSISPPPAPPASTKGLKGASGRLGDVGKEAGLTGTKPLEEVIGGYIKGALVLVGTVFLILMVYGGYIWMIARGDEAEVKRAKGIIETAVIGIAIVLAAYAITYFVVYRLTQATGAGL